MGQVLAAVDCSGVSGKDWLSLGLRNKQAGLYWPPALWLRIDDLELLGCSERLGKLEHRMGSELTGEPFCWAQTFSSDP